MLGHPCPIDKDVYNIYTAQTYYCIYWLKLKIVSLLETQNRNCED